MKITKEVRKYIQKRAKSYRRMMLARPKPCRLKPWPDPELERKLPAPIPRACLNPKLSPEILKLYHAKTRPIVPKFVRPLPPEHYVKFSALSYKPSERLVKLSVPKTLPQPPSPPPKTKKQKHWEQLLRAEMGDWIEARSKPKKIPLPPELPHKKKRVPLSQLIERINFLATPALHHQWQRPQPPPFRLREIPPLSDRVVVLAQPRKVPSEALLNLNFDPYEIKPGTLNAKPNATDIRLAIPKKRIKAVDTDFKENAFMVSPTAKTYVATKRILQLAKPKERH